MDSLQGASGTGAPELRAVDVLIACIVVLLTATLSSFLRLGLEVRLFVGAVRSAGQLTGLGLLLHAIFNISNLWMVLGYLLAMALIAAYEARSRAKYIYRGLYLQILLVIVVVVFPLSLFANGAVMKSRPWYNPQSIIPITGMILGNCVSSISLTLRNLLERVETVEQRVAFRLSAGATRWEAFLPEIQDTMTTAMTPIINMMNIIGLVSIPGMMTGQILGGASPMQAALYQLIILFMICAVCANSCFLICWFVTRSLVHQSHFLNIQDLQPLASLPQWLYERVEKYWHLCSKRKRYLLLVDNGEEGENPGAHSSQH
mmetsp:Transcript_13693/g.34477  ORF Transcript_13693/g.34477 Transcript_13693/m.34477 type:complete len:317 (+) Transcript_13693:1600-2550(+)